MKLSITEKTAQLHSENVELRAKLGHPAPAPSTSTLTPAQRLEQERIQNDALRAQVEANTPPPPAPKPEKPLSKLKQIEARFKSDPPPRGEELESICKDLLGELEKRL